MTMPPAARGAVVLAGGQSTRMGRDKASLPLGDRPLVGHVVRALAQVVGEIVLVTRRGQAVVDVGPLPAGVVLRRVHDETEGLGPLGGLAPGLRALEAPVAFVTGCDLPFLSPAFVRAVLEALGDADVALPCVRDRLEPLAGAYRRATVLPAVETLLAEGRLRTLDVFDRVRGVRVSEATLRAVDPDLRSLTNLNDPGAYEAALRRLPGPPVS